MTIDWVAFIVFAFLGSFGHCVGMCGGIVASYAGSFGILGHLYYGFGKTSAYIILGAIAGALGGIFRFHPTTFAILFILLGIAMIFFGAHIALQSQLLGKLEQKLAGFVPIAAMFRFARTLGTKGIFILGFANGLLPCGLVYMALLTAAGSASALIGGALMGIFGICTLVPLYAFGALAQWLGSRYRGFVLRALGLFAIGFGIWFIITGVGMFTDPTATMHKH